MKEERQVEKRVYEKVGPGRNDWVRRSPDTTCRDAWEASQGIRNDGEVSLQLGRVCGLNDSQPEPPTAGLPPKMTSSQPQFHEPLDTVQVSILLPP